MQKRKECYPGSLESERDFRDTVNTAVGKPLAAAIGTFSSNISLPIGLYMWSVATVLALEATL